jgi:hypothetical protein
MDQIFSIYNQFLSYFPQNIHGLVSLALAVLIVIGIFKVIKKDFIYIILLVLFRCVGRREIIWLKSVLDIKPRSSAKESQ